MISNGRRAVLMTPRVTEGSRLRFGSAATSRKCLQAIGCTMLQFSKQLGRKVALALERLERFIEAAHQQQDRCSRDVKSDCQVSNRPLQRETSPGRHPEKPRDQATHDCGQNAGGTTADYGAHWLASSMPRLQNQRYPERFEEVSWQAKSRTRKVLPRQVNEVLKEAAALTEEAKGLADGIRL
jgi:hypothetical protein